MSLPGKLCIGILEEDNPLRSYFRFKPLLVDDNGRYQPYEAAQDYPQEGCIRIVPDKNESYHFKARMRQIGLFCVVDLREHPGDSDKIRPNKNFRPSGEEINASIIYSDVVRAPVEDMILELLPAEAAERVIAAPRTPAVLVRDGEGINPLRHTWEPVPGTDDEGRLVASEEPCPLDEMQVFDLPGFQGQVVSFAIRPAGGMDRVCDMPERHVPAPEHRVVPEPAPHEAEAPQEPSEPRAPQPAPETFERAGEKPWIHRDETMLPTPVNPKLSRSEQLLAAQAGLNPRRGRSLQELIDEKWQRSRLNQLGQPVAPIATGTPVQSPVDTAMDALRTVWRQPRLREALLDAIDDLAGLRQSFEARREARRQSAISDELDDLEAQKLKLLADLDHLKAGNAELRQRLKQDIRREDAAELADAAQRAREAREEQAKWEQQAADARAAAQDAQSLLDQLAGDQLEQKIRDVALTRRVLERLDHLRPTRDKAPAEAAEQIDLNAFIERTIARFDAEGWTLSRTEAANLCVCLILGPALLITGAPGSGKTAAARLLAEALGLKPTPLAPQGGRHEGGAPLKRLGDRPAVILMDDANLAPGPDPLARLRGMTNPEWRAVATLQDAHSGHPVCAAAWDAGFAVRLTPPAGLPWQPAERRAIAPIAPASIAALREALPQAPVPTAIVARLDALRKALAGCGADFSRRGLNDAWRYTAAMLAALGDDADPMAVLDLAVAQRLLPTLLCSAPIEAIAALRPLIQDLPACASLLTQPLPMTI